MWDLTSHGLWTCSCTHKIDKGLWQTFGTFDLVHSSCKWIQAMLLCQCRLGLFQDSDFARDLEDSRWGANKELGHFSYTPDLPHFCSPTFSHVWTPYSKMGHFCPSSPLCLWHFLIRIPSDNDRQCLRERPAEVGCLGCSCGARCLACSGCLRLMVWVFRVFNVGFMGVGCWFNFVFGRTETTPNAMWGSNLTLSLQKKC